MIVVDTSVWVDFLRAGDDRLATLIASDRIVQHPFVTGELGMGNFRSEAERGRTLGWLHGLTQLRIVEDETHDRFVASQRLFGTGLGFIDGHLLASLAADPGPRLWTRDKRLALHAERLNLPLLA